MVKFLSSNMALALFFLGFHIFQHVVSPFRCSITSPQHCTQPLKGMQPLPVPCRAELSSPKPGFCGMRCRLTFPALILTALSPVL